MSTKHKLLTILSVFAALFLISLIFFLIDADDIKYRVIFFPEDNSDNLTGEVRKLKSRGSLEKDIESLLREILLGPEKLENSRYIPHDARLNSVMLRDRVLYADYSDGIISSDLLFKSPETGNTSGTENGAADQGDMVLSKPETEKQAESKTMTLSEVFSIISQTVDFNFPSVRQIVFTIDGEIPNFGKPAEGNGS